MQELCTTFWRYSLLRYVPETLAKESGSFLLKIHTVLFFFFSPAKMIQISQKNLPKRGEKNKVKNIGSQEVLFHAFPKMFCVVPHTLRSILASILIKR